MVAPAFHVGQQVLIYMGVAGGYWQGTVHELVDATNLRVVFGLKPNGDFAMSMPVAIDKNLIPQPTTQQEARIVRAQVDAQLARDAARSAKLDVPLWSKDFFGPENGPIPGTCSMMICAGSPGCGQCAAREAAEKLLEER